MENSQDCLKTNLNDSKKNSRVANETLDDSAGIRQSEEKEVANLSSCTTNNFSHHRAVSISPPTFIPMQCILEATSKMHDMTLAHEIAVNEKFLLEKTSKQGDTESQTKDVNEDFWEDLQQQLNETPPNSTNTMFLFKVIKDSMMKILLPHHGRIRNQIDETLDLDLIRQQVETKVLDYRGHADYIISVMERLCAPVRDQMIEKLKSMDDVVPLYKRILDTLELMKLDLANFTIQQMRPHIQQHSVDYEKEKFKEFINQLASLSPPVDYLKLTKEWLKGVFEKTKDAASPGAQFTTSAISKKAFVELLVWSNEEKIPETLLMDKERFLSVRNQFTEVVLAASSLLLIYAIVGEPIHGISSLKLRLKDQMSVLLKNAANIQEEHELKKLMQSVALQITKVVNDGLIEHGSPALSNAKAADMASQIEDIGASQNSVRKLITARILEFMENVLNSSNAASVKIPPGLSTFQKELLVMAGTFLRLVNYNQAVFGEYYTDIITKIMAMKS